MKKKLCKCGCGQKVIIKPFHKQKTYNIPKYITGHHMKDKVYLKKLKTKKSWGDRNEQISKTKLGVPNLKLRGYKQSEEHIKKRFESLKETISNPEYIKKHKSILAKIMSTKEWKEKFKKGVSTPEFKEKCRKISTEVMSDKTRREVILNLAYKNLSIKPNKPEKQIINLIKQNNLPFNYVGDGKIWFSNNNHSFNPDFLSKNPKHIIEVFGDYWHKDTQKLDKERIRTYKKYGYKTLIIWEHELKNKDIVLNKIRKFING